MKINPFTCRKSKQKIQMWTFWCIINITGLRLTWGASGLYTKIQNVKKKKEKNQNNCNRPLHHECRRSSGGRWMDGWIGGSGFFHTAATSFSSSFCVCVFLVSEGLRRQSRLQNPSGYCPQISRWWNGERDLWSSPHSDEKRFHHEQTATVMPAWAAGTMWVSMSPVGVFFV